MTTKTWIFDLAGLLLFIGWRHQIPHQRIRQIPTVSSLPLTLASPKDSAWPMISGQPGRGEVCMKCRADLRVCLNCTHYDPRVAEQCRERRADLVLEKAVGNFCEYFDFIKRVWAAKTGVNSREAAAREQFKKLFRD